MVDLQHRAHHDQLRGGNAVLGSASVRGSGARNGLGPRLAFLIVVCIVSTLALAGSFSLRRQRPEPPPTTDLRAQNTGSNVIAPARAAPLRIAPRTNVAVSLDHDAVAAAVGRLRLQEFPGLSLLLHSASLFGLESPAPGYTGPEPASIKDVLFAGDVRASYFSSDPLFVKTAWGRRNLVQMANRVQWQPERQAHLGQLLSEFAKQGVSLDEVITTDSESFPIADLLQDTIAIYDHSEPQLEWNCIALALYLPPRTTWSNKFGHRFSFDIMAEELMERRLGASESSCHGIHLLEALVILLRADAEHDILSPDVHSMVKTHLLRQVADIERTRFPDGSFSPVWYNGADTLPLTGIADATVHSRVHATGHHVDWMLLLPSDLSPPDDLYDQAAAFLLASLQSCSDDDLHLHYCPYSHAGRVLQQLASRPAALADGE
jgi:hypothetical protein